MISRRFLLAAGMCGRLCFAKTKVHLGCQTNAWKIDPKNFSTLLAVLDKIKGYGFEGFETGFANVEGQFQDPSSAKEQIARTGLRFFGVHIFLLQYDPQTSIAPANLYQRVTDGAARMGAERLILSGTAAPADPALQRKAEGLNRVARYARQRGLRFAYHNHDAEFAKGGLEIEALLRQTDPALVDLLLDAGHAYEAKANVAAFLRKHHARIAGMHLRDYKSGEQVPLGQGSFDLHGLAKAIDEVNWDGWVLLEEERLQGVKPGDSAVAPARETLRRVFGA